MLQAGVDITVIALWLGHESPVTTHRYVEADLQMKDRALQALQAPSRKAFRYKPKDDLLRFLQGLQLCKLDGRCRKHINVCLDATTSTFRGRTSFHKCLIQPSRQNFP